MLIIRQIGFAGTAAAPPAGQVSRVYTLGFSGSASGIPSSRTFVFGFSGTATYAVLTPGFVRYICFTGDVPQYETNLVYSIGFTGVVTNPLIGYSIQAIEDSLVIIPVQMYDGLDSVVIAGTTYRRTFELYQSSNGVDYTKIGSSTNKYIPFTYTTGLTLYYRLAVNYYDTGGTPYTALYSYLDLDAWTPFTGTNNTWAGVGLSTVDLMSVAITDEGENALTTTFNSGVVFLPNGDGWWLGSGIEMVCVPDASTDDNCGIPLYEVDLTPLLGATPDHSQYWPLVVWYRRDTVDAPAAPTTVDKLLYDVIEPQSQLYTMLRVVDPTRHHKLGYSQPIAYTNWDTGIITEYRFVDADTSAYIGLPIGSYMLDVYNNKLYIRPHHTIGDGYNCFHVGAGQTSTVPGPVISDVLYRGQQPYVVIKDIDPVTTTLIPETIYAECGKDDTPRINQKLPLIIKIVDKIGGPISGAIVTISKQVSGSWTALATAQTDETGFAVDTTTSVIPTITPTSVGTMLIRISLDYGQRAHLEKFMVLEIHE